MELFEPSKPMPAADAKLPVSSNQQAALEQLRLKREASRQQETEAALSRQEMLCQWEELTAYERRRLSEIVRERYGAEIADRGDDSWLFIQACLGEKRKADSDGGLMP